MWTKCQIKVMDQIETGTSRLGNEYQRQRIVLCWGEIDAQGNPLKSENGTEVVSNASFELGKNKIEELQTIGAQVGWYVWADIRCKAEQRQSQKGNWYVTNNLYVAGFMKV